MAEASLAACADAVKIVGAVACVGAGLVFAEAIGVALLVGGARLRSAARGHTKANAIEVLAYVAGALVHAVDGGVAFVAWTPVGAAKLSSIRTQAIVLLPAVRSRAAAAVLEGLLLRHGLFATAAGQVEEAEGEPEAASHAASIPWTEDVGRVAVDFELGAEPLAWARRLLGGPARTGAQ